MATDQGVAESAEIDGLNLIILSCIERLTDVQSSLDGAIYHLSLDQTASLHRAGPCLQFVIDLLTELCSRDP
jgi:hypothetical protein